MSHEIVMPQLGLSMNSGRIIRWAKGDGDFIKLGEALFEVESDKATIAVEAIYEGRLSILKPAGDQEIEVGGVVGYILEESDQIPTKPDIPSPPSQTVKKVFSISQSVQKSTAEPETINFPSQTTERALSSPAARKLAEELGIDLKLVPPSGLHGQVKLRDIRRFAEASQMAIPADVNISPLARSLAETLGITLGDLAAQYPGERIDREQVFAYARVLISGANRRGIPAQSVLKGVSANIQTGESQPASRLRLLIADRMATSAHTTAPVTLTREVDATALVELRAAFKNDESLSVTPSYNVMFAKMVAQALFEHPQINATLKGNEIQYWQIVNIGIAVDTPQGLIVPVLRDVQRRNLFDLSNTADDLAKRVLQGKILPDELRDGTFTITNLGSLGIDAFTPIINLPECAILGIGRFQKKVMVMPDNTTAIRTATVLSLTFDHRLVDGAPAARFLDRVSQFVQAPGLWLARASAG
jgi:pyruvate dehydrogenase E2 component (dihydrolipoamide acetyltransferase)